MVKNLKPHQSKKQALAKYQGGEKSCSISSSSFSFHFRLGEGGLNRCCCGRKILARLIFSITAKGGPTHAHIVQQGHHRWPPSGGVMMNLGNKAGENVRKGDENVKVRKGR